MHPTSKVAALAAIVSTSLAEFVSVPPFPTPATGTAPLGTGTAPVGTGTAPLGTGTGIGTIIVTGTGTATFPTSTGTVRTPSLPRAGNVYFINQCPFPLYVSTNTTSVRKPAELPSSQKLGHGQCAYQFEILNPAQTYKPEDPSALPISTLGSASPTGAVSEAEPEPTIVDRGLPWHRSFRHRGHNHAHGHRWNATQDLGVDITISRKADEITDSEEGHIMYYAHEGTYDYQMTAPDHFLNGMKTQVDPAGPDCKATEGWTGETESCAWSADMWITFCLGHVGHMSE